MAVGGLTSSINAALRDASLSAATKAQLEVRPVTEISMPETVLTRARETPGVLAASADLADPTVIRSDWACADTGLDEGAGSAIMNWFRQHNS